MQYIAENNKNRKKQANRVEFPVNLFYYVKLKRHPGYASQEGIIRTMKEIHGSYYFLRKNISALSLAEFRDFKGFLRETDSLPFGDISTIYTNKRSQIYIALKRYMKDFARFLCYRGL